MFSFVYNMDLITKSSGLHHIAENIFAHLDHENLLKCQEVNKYWKNILDNPQFWINLAHSKSRCDLFGGVCMCKFDYLNSTNMSESHIADFIELHRNKQGP